MANNTVLPPGGGGDTITLVDIGSFTAYPADGKLAASALYVSANVATEPTPVSNANPLPISDAGGSLTIDGTVVVGSTVDVSGSIVDVSGSAVSVTNAFALDATLTGGSAKAIVRGGAKGATTAADVTSSAIDADHQALDVYIRGGAAAGGTSSSFGAAIPASGTAAGFNDGTNMQLGRVFDVDSGGGTQFVVGVNLRASGSGGSTELLGQKTMAGSIPVVFPSDQGIALDATLTGGTAKAIIRGGAKGSTTAADVTSSASGANHQAIDVAMYDGNGNNAVRLAGETIATPPGIVSLGQVGTELTPLQMDATDAALIVTALATSPVRIDPTGTTTQPVKLATQTSGGPTVLTKILSAASTNATSVKGSAGQIYGLYVTNTNASPRFLKLYNKASAPTVGTDTPVQVYLIPGNTAGAGFHRSIPHGIPFGTGIALAITTGVADADTGAVAANEVIVNLEYA